MKSQFLSTLASLSLVAAAASPSFAQERYKPYPRHHHVSHIAVVDAAPPLTVHGRSYLDPGVVAPVGSESAYVADSTTFNQPTRDLFYGRFDSNLPGPLDVPGRSEPLIDFETPALP